MGSFPKPKLILLYWRSCFAFCFGGLEKIQEYLSSGQKTKNRTFKLKVVNDLGEVFYALTGNCQ